MSVKEKMTALADAVRAGTGGTAALTLDEIIAAVQDFAASDGQTQKSGTTSAASFDTGLSSIAGLALYKSAIDSTGLIQCVFSGTSSNYVYCSSYSTNVNSCTTGSQSYSSADGGTFTWGGSGTAAMVEGAVYNWIAWGQA